MVTSHLKWWELCCAGDLLGCDVKAEDGHHVMRGRPDDLCLVIERIPSSFHTWSSVGLIILRTPMTPQS